MAKKFDVISIGDTTLDVFLELDEANAKVICQNGDDDCVLQLAFADKIPVKKVTKVPAVGNAANVAVGCARLGLKAALYTILGVDQSGKEAFERLKSEKVAKDYIVWDKKRGTNYSAVINYKGERTILVFHEPREYDLPKLASSDWIYLTAIGKNHEKMDQQIIDYVEKTGAKLGFNPGDLQLREGLEALKPLIKKCTVFFVNKQEAERLVGKNDDVKALLKMLYDMGAKIVVITDGKNGSYSFDGKEVYFQKVLHVPLIEMTGSGDSYSTGFISALQLGHSIPEAMKWGTTNAAAKLQKIGAQEGLLYRKEMEGFIKGTVMFDFIKDNSGLNPQKI
jgi:sugar/nucleoside kinase (ribokinase family)